MKEKHKLYQDFVQCQQKRLHFPHLQKKASQQNQNIFYRDDNDPY